MSYQPKLIWTAKWLATWQRAQAAYNAGQTTDPGYPYYASLVGYGTNNSGTDNFGLAATILYQITGQTSWAQTAWNWLSQWVLPGTIGDYNPCDNLPPAADSNSLHVRGLIYVLMYDWLKPYILTLPTMSNGLSAQQNVLNWLNWLCGMNLNTYQNHPNDPNGPNCRSAHASTYSSYGLYNGNVNGVVGSYANLIFTALATAPENGQASSYLNAAASGTTVGGLDPVGYDPNNSLTWAASVRNTLEHAWQESAGALAGLSSANTLLGGVWCEGNEYESASLQCMCLLAAGVKTAQALVGDNTDHFPTFTAFLPRYAQAFLSNLMPGESDLYQRGDTQFAHQLALTDRLCNAMLVLGLTEGNIVANYLQKLLQEWATFPGGSGWKVRAALLYDPYLPAVDWRASLPHQVQGLGQALIRSGQTGWNAATDSVCITNSEPQTFCNHTGPDQEIGSLCLYRKGEWVFDVIRSYGGIGIDGNGRNCVQLYGMTAMFDQRGPLACEFGADYMYTLHQSYGNLYPSSNDGFHNQYSPMPPEYFHELTRSVLYIKSTDQTSDTVIVFARTNAEDPYSLSGLPHWNHYRSGDWTRLGWASTETGPYAPKQAGFNLPINNPTITGNVCKWTTAGGQQAQITTLLPSAYSYAIRDLNALFNPAYSGGPSPYSYGNYIASTLHYRYDVLLDKPGGAHPASQFDCLCHVLQAADNGVSITAQRVVSSDGRMAGAQVHRGSQHEILALFSQVSSVVNGSVQPTVNDVTQRVISAGSVSVTWTAGLACSEVFLCDLKPGATYLVQVDSLSAKTFVASNAGVIRLTVSGARQHTLTVTAH